MSEQQSTVDETVDRSIRIEVKKDGRVELLVFGIGELDDDTMSYYDSVDALPEWVQERLATLMLLNHKPPPPMSIDGIGMRISSNVFWVIRPAGAPLRSEHCLFTIKGQIVKKKVSMTERVRRMVLNGASNKAIIDKLQCKPQIVYNVRYQFNKAKGLGALKAKGTGIKKIPRPRPVVREFPNNVALPPTYVPIMTPVNYKPTPVASTPNRTLWQRIKSLFGGK